MNLLGVLCIAVSFYVVIVNMPEPITQPCEKRDQLRKRQYEEESVFVHISHHSIIFVYWEQQISDSNAKYSNANPDFCG